MVRGHIRIGATQVLGSIDLPRSLAGFHSRYPGVTLTLRTGLIARLLGDLDSGAIDVVLGPVHDDLPGRFAARALVPEHLLLVTPPGRPAPASPTLAAFAGEPFVCLPSGSGLHTILADAARAAGFTPRIEFETYSAASVRALVAAGLGVALLAESAIRAPGPAVQAHRLRPAPEHPPIGVIGVRGRTPGPAVRAWRQHLNQNYGTLSPVAGTMAG